MDGKSLHHQYVPLHNQQSYILFIREILWNDGQEKRVQVKHAVNSGRYVDYLNRIESSKQNIMMEKYSITDHLHCLSWNM